MDGVQKGGNEKRSRYSIKLRMKGRVRKKQKRDGKGRKQDKRGTKRGGTGEGKKEFVEEERKGAGTGLKRHEEGRGGRNSCVKV